MGEIANIEWIKIEELIPYENNSKTHSKKQIKQISDSIKEFGFISPVLIDEKNIIIAGHGRIEAAKTLKIEKAPCIRVEGLTDEQRKAYIIADNRLTELGGWNKELLTSELDLLKSKNFKLDLTGFNIKNLQEMKLKPQLAYGAERERTVKTYNLDKINRVDMSNDYWELPIIERCDYIPKKLIGFNYAKTSNNKEAGIHFFLDDYQFERIWYNPENYLEILTEYDCVLSPEFSLYWEMPLPMKIWNTYRNRFIGSYLQRYGITVIPTICWADEKTYDFCFSGVEKGGTVAVETHGVKEKQEITERWKNGMNELIRRIEPSTILIYGGKIDFDYGNIQVVYYENEVLKKWKNK